MLVALRCVTLMSDSVTAPNAPLVRWLAPPAGPNPVLLLSEPVRFVNKLQDASHRLGDPLSLTCTYAGSKRAHVSRTKDGKLIWASYQYNVKTGDSSCTLEVLNSDSQDAAGLYSCQLSNAEGSAACDAYVSVRSSKKGTRTNTRHRELTHPAPRPVSVPLVLTRLPLIT